MCIQIWCERILDYFHRRSPLVPIRTSSLILIFPSIHNSWIAYCQLQNYQRASEGMHFNFFCFVENWKFIESTASLTTKWCEKQKRKRKTMSTDPCMDSVQKIVLCLLLAVQVRACQRIRSRMCIFYFQFDDFCIFFFFSLASVLVSVMKKQIFSFLKECSDRSWLCLYGL